MHIFHKWTKWEEYVWQGRIGYSSTRDSSNAPIMTDCTEQRQKRRCTECGLSQDRFVGY